MDPLEFPFFDVEAYKRQSELEERLIKNLFRECRKKILEDTQSIEKRCFKRDCSKANRILIDGYFSDNRPPSTEAEKMGLSKSCKVCEQAQSKYKCPAYLIPYCSLACFKKHKEIPCVKPAPLPEASMTTSLPADIERPSSMDEPSKTLQPVHVESTANYLQVDIERPCYVDNPSNVLQQLQLESIASSSEIREALKNEELQNLIRNVDGSVDSQTELDKAMDLEAFRVFTDKILSTITK